MKSHDLPSNHAARAGGRRAVAAAMEALAGPQLAALAVLIVTGVQGVTYTARREGLMSGAFLLESTAGVVARATKPSALRRPLIVEHSGRRYTLRAASALRREFALLDGSTRIGSLSPEGTFTRRAAVDLPSVLPLTVRVFIVWLTVMLWKHDQME